MALRHRSWYGWLALVAAVCLLPWMGTTAQEERDRPRDEPAARERSDGDRPRERPEADRTDRPRDEDRREVPDPVRLRQRLLERVEQLEREVQELRQRGGEEARQRVEAVGRELAEIRRRLQEGAEEVAPALGEARRRAEERMRQLRQRLEEHLRSGRAEAAEAVRRELSEAAEGFERLRGRPEFAPHPHGEAMRQLHHLRAAIENLAAAGMHDLAEPLRREMARREEALRPHPPRDGGPDRPVHRITIDITDEGQLRLGDRALGADELQEVLRREAGDGGGQWLAVIRASREAPGKAVLQAVEACRAAGIQNITFAGADQRRDD